MSHLYDDYPAAGPSYSGHANSSAGWSSYEMPYDDQYDNNSPCAICSPGGAYGESGSTYPYGIPGSAQYASSCYASPEMLPFDEYEREYEATTTPISPSSSASSASFDAPVTPSHQLPVPVGLLYTKLDPPIEEDEYRECDAWEEEDDDEDATQTYRAFEVPMTESCASAQFQHSDTSPPAVRYTPADILAAPGSSPQHARTNAHEYPSPTSAQPPMACLSPALLSFCSPPPPQLKLHQPQPRRSIPLISLSALANESASAPPQADPVSASPAPSPLDLQSFQFPPPQPPHAYGRVIVPSSYPGPGPGQSSLVNAYPALPFAASAYPGFAVPRLSLPRLSLPRLSLYGDGMGFVQRSPSQPHLLSHIQ
ncbi:hypothetical protein GGX14DRAFT_398295 [Mycena pura]|uniref:Uncharacterized protein n=1 Tax=Mycena pura TaxID=153505 RepID=A0AAD6V7B1_9AGAR|nr:hypothetical protein GGX14DRAFT_398295 [Mycena pura]